MKNEFAKWLTLMLIVTAFLVLVVSIGSSFNIFIGIVGYKLEVWVFLLIFLAYVLVIAFKKNEIKIEIPEKAIKVFVDVVKEEQSFTQASLAINKKKIQNKIDIDKVKPWKDVDVGEIFLDGEEVS